MSRRPARFPTVAVLHVPFALALALASAAAHATPPDEPRAPAAAHATSLDEPRAPAAASRSATYRIIKLDGREVYVDVGTSGGAVPAAVRVYRVETVRDPATGEAQQGRVLLGRLLLGRVGDRFSIGSAEARLAAELRVGDLVEPEPPGVSPPAATVPRPVVTPTTYSAETATPTLRRHAAPRPWAHDTQHRLSVNGRYVSYGKDTDQYGQLEADYSYTLRIPILRALRFGGGALAGRSPLAFALAGQTPSGAEDVRFYYGLVEVELELNEWLGWTNALLLGVNNDGIGGGWMSALRLGHVAGVNVRAGGQLRTFVGHQAFLGLEVPVGRHFKLTPRVLIENMIRGRDYGFRFDLQGEVRLGRSFGLLAEVGAGARDIKTGGFNGSVGLATYF